MPQNSRTAVVITGEIVDPERLDTAERARLGEVLSQAFGDDRWQLLVTEPHRALRGWTQEQIGSLWEPSVTQPTVANHLRAAHWEAVAATVDLYETRFDVEGRETSVGSI